MPLKIVGPRHQKEVRGPVIYGRLLLDARWVRLFGQTWDNPTETKSFVRESVRNGWRIEITGFGYPGFIELNVKESDEPALNAALVENKIGRRFGSRVWAKDIPNQLTYIVTHSPNVTKTPERNYHLATIDGEKFGLGVGDWSDMIKSHVGNTIVLDLTDRKAAAISQWGLAATINLDPTIYARAGDHVRIYKIGLDGQDWTTVIRAAAAGTGKTQNTVTYTEKQAAPAGFSCGRTAMRFDTSPVGGVTSLKVRVKMILGPAQSLGLTLADYAIWDHLNQYAEILAGRNDGAKAIGRMAADAVNGWTSVSPDFADKFEITTDFYLALMRWNYDWNNFGDPPSGTQQSSWSIAGDDDDPVLDYVMATPGVGIIGDDILP